MTQTPALVQRAVAMARQLDFPLTRQEAAGSRPSASLPEVGRFLAVLAAGCPGGRIAELGTGVGIGSAWISSAMPADCSLITAELDPARAAAAREVLSGDPRVQVLTGDALQLLPPLAPFDLIFSDGGIRAPGDFTTVVSMLKPCGRIVSDDVTPKLALPADSPFRDADPKRTLFASDDRLVWTEVVLPDLANSLLVGTRIS